MPFGAGRGSPQIVGAGGEEGKQAPEEAGQVQLLRLLEEVGRQGHEGLTLQDGDEGGDSGVVGAQEMVELELDGLEDRVEDMVVDEVVDGVVDKVEVGVVGEGIARQGEEDSDEGSEMEGDGKRVAQVEEVVGSDAELEMVQVQVQEELTAPEEVDNAEGDVEEEQVGERGMEQAEARKLVQEVQRLDGGMEQVMGSLVG